MIEATNQAVEDSVFELPDGSSSVDWGTQGEEFGHHRRAKAFRVRYHSDCFIGDEVEHLVISIGLVKTRSPGAHLGMPIPHDAGGLATRLGMAKVGEDGRGHWTTRRAAYLELVALC